MSRRIIWEVHIKEVMSDFITKVEISNLKLMNHVDCWILSNKSTRKTDLEKEF